MFSPTSFDCNAVCANEGQPAPKAAVVGASAQGFSDRQLTGEITPQQTSTGQAHCAGQADTKIGESNEQLVDQFVNDTHALSHQ